MEVARTLNLRFKKMNKKIFSLVFLAITATIFVYSFFDYNSLSANVTIIKLNLSCSETDGGRNYAKAGITTFSKKPYKDVCKTDKTLTEFYCQGDKIKQASTNCDCQTSACQKPEKGDACFDFMDNDKDGLFDCYDPTCADYKNKGYSQCYYYEGAKTYSGPGVYTLKNHDRIKFPDGLIAEITDLQYLEKISDTYGKFGENNFSTILWKLYYEKDGKIIIHPAGSASLRFSFPGFPILSKEPLNTLNVLPFISLNNTYVYLKGVDVTNKTVKVEVFKSCKDIYNLCVADTNMAGEDGDYLTCEQYACPYEAFSSEYEKEETAKFKIVYPKVDKKYADIVMKYLPGCYDKMAELFGKKQNIDQLTVYFFNKAKNNSGLPWGVAQGDSLNVVYNGKLSHPSPEDPSKVCGASFFPFAHEMTHIFHFWTMIPGELHEGFANYVPSKYDPAKNQYPMICMEDGYYYSDYFTENDINDPVIIPYSQTKSFYILGECFWRRLEVKYGLDKMKVLLKKLGSIRNIPKPKDESYDFLNEILAPIYGSVEIENIKDIADSLGLQIDCKYKFGQAAAQNGLIGECSD